MSAFEPFAFQKRVRQLLTDSPSVAGFKPFSNAFDATQITVKTDALIAFIEGTPPLEVEVQFNLDRITEHKTQFSVKINLKAMAFPFWPSLTEQTFMDTRHALVLRTVIEATAKYLNQPSWAYAEKLLNGIQFRQACVDFHEVLTMFRPASFTFIFAGCVDAIYARWSLSEPRWDHNELLELRYNYKTQTWIVKVADTDLPDRWFIYPPYRKLRDVFSNLFEREWRLDILEPVAFAKQHGQYADIQEYDAALNRLLSSEL